MRSLLFIRRLSKRCAVAHPVVRPVNARCSRLTLVQYPWHALYPRQRLSTSSQCINTEECGGCDGNECLCWRCGSCVNKAALFCGSCHYIQHVKDTANYFDLLGMPHVYDIDLSALEANFKSKQKEVHPDLFGSKTEEEREASAEASSVINVAYKILRDPSQRAQYLLKLNNYDAIGETVGTLHTDPALLMEIMEARELTEDPDTSLEDLSELARSNREAIKNCEEQLAQAFANSDFETARNITIALQYYTKLRREVEEAMHVKSRDV